MSEVCDNVNKGNNKSLLLLPWSYLYCVNYRMLFKHAQAC